MDEGSKLISDLKTLIADAEELLKATTNQAGETVSVARKKIEQSLGDARKALSDAEDVVLSRSKEYVDVADEYVRENPWGAIGVAAGIGFLFALLLKRS